MSEAVTPQAPAAETAPAIAPAETAAVVAPDHKSRARDLAGKFLSAGGDKQMLGEKGKAAEAPAEAPVEPVTEPAKVAATTTEQKKPEAPAKPAADDPLEKSWKEVRRRKAQQLEQRRAFEAEKAALAAKESAIAAKAAEAEADARLRDEDPNAWLEKHKFDLREVALREVEKQNLTPEQKAAKAKADAERAAREKADRDRDAEIAELRKFKEEVARERAERKQSEALATIKDETKREWTAAKSEFPTLSEHYTPDEIADAATQLRLDHYRKTQREVGLEEVFAHMERNAAREKARFSRQQAQAEAERTERATVDAKASKTRAKVGPPVTNRDSATKTAPTTRLTEAEKRARAVAIASENWGPRQ